ncbi:MAG TPA: efflux RND transporter periplasmic adaptor subunit [Chryseolinea sp.]|nr:efflux RND transporter periplasmic adaptor subunit [Chryseolinea sp.]
MKRNITIFASLLTLVSCTTDNHLYDASGTFEAIETIVSSEASGTIKKFDVLEGQILKQGQFVGYIDSIQLHLQRKQVHAQIRAVLSRKPNISKQLAAEYEQLSHAKSEQQRIARLLKADAATQKQYDDAVSQIAVIEGRIEGQESSLATTTSSLTQEVQPLQIQIEQLDDQISKCKIVNEVNGTVLEKYAEAYETAVAGKPLYKIADLSSIILRAYITADQLSRAKLNQQVTVLVDAGEGKYTQHPGLIEWISNQAEFTPKTIQTQDERANLVYAAKIRVKNDGSLKIGMYGEVKL